MSDFNWVLPHILILKSSAGAGKTYNLALRYLQLLILDKITPAQIKTHISNIVAITFTNKAAAEMRSRIIDWMKRIILDLPFEGSQRKPIDEILTLEPSNPRTLEPLIRTAIEKNFDDLLENYYDFNVSTIDSFVNLTLKASAFKLNLPPDFDISTESGAQIDFVLQECLQKILEDDGIREKFDRFLKNYIELEGDNIGWIPKNFIQDIISSLWNEESKESIGFSNKTSVGLLDFIQTKIENDILELKSYLCSTPGIKPHSGFLNALDQFSVSNKYGFKISAFMKRLTIQESLNKNSAPAAEKYEQLWKEIKIYLSSFIEILSESRYASYLEIYELFKRMFQVEVTLHKGLILIEQLNMLLQKIVKNEHFVPEIYYALAERYSHFLIDEFQDTNHLQWSNIEILAEEALSRGGTLFLVGDKKQAIYRWRGGKAELIDDISSRYQSYPVYELKLDKNYRSEEYIVHFNNIIFNPDKLQNVIQLIKETDPVDINYRFISSYEESGQIFLESKSGKGYVHIEKIIQEDNYGNTKEKFLKDEKNALIKDRLKTLVEQLKERNTFQYEDIAVLVRRKEEARFIVKTLLEMGLSVESDFTVNIKNNPLIDEIISFLTFINSPDDDLSFAGFLSGKIFQKKTGFNGNEIMNWITHQRIYAQSEYLYPAFKRDFPDIWDQYFDYFFKNSGYLPVYDFVVLFLKKWAVLNNFDEDSTYFLHMCELIKAQEVLQQNNLTRFLEFWNNDREKEEPFLLKTTSGTNAIKVMTIHKAKGLQFPVVILPFLKLNTFGSSDSKDKTKYFVNKNGEMNLLYIKKDFAEYSEKLKEIYIEREVEYILDELNNIYVACTRAKNELYVFLTDAKKQKNHLIDYFFNLDDLKMFIHDNMIEMGEKKTGIERRIAEGRGHRTNKHEGKKQSTGYGEQLFDGIGEDIRWMEYIKTKVEEPDAISTENLFAKKKGDVIHYILSLISKLPEDYEAFLDKCIITGIARHGFHNHELIIKETINSVFSNPEFKRFFQPEDTDTVYTEQEIVDSKGDTHKIDRIVMTNNCIDVIDFKTGESQSKEHIDQLARYGNIIRMMYPGKTIYRYLLYLDTGEVKTL